MTSDLLEPPSQVINFNLKCPVCWSIVKPTDDPESGATECMECEVAICKMCVSQLKKEECPSCRNGDQPVFKKRLGRLRKQELEGLKFKFPKDCGEVFSHLDVYDHIIECKACSECIVLKKQIDNSESILKMYFDKCNSLNIKV